MNMGEWDTKKFKALKAKWDKKLENSGFEDIENSDGSLKAGTDPRAIQNALKEKEEREIYYSIASEFLETHAFKEGLHRDIWQLHAEGLGKLSIAQKLKITPYRVETTINEYRILAKLRKS